MHAMTRQILAGGLLLAGAMIVSVPARAAGDPAAGQVIFNGTCANCHSTEIGVNKIGPSLYHVIGRKAGSVPDFAYTDAMKASGEVWTAETLDVYLTNPRGTVHGVKMFFQGLPSANERADVIAYLQSLQ